jgi:hypothetical protein
MKDGGTLMNGIGWRWVWVGLCAGLAAGCSETAEEVSSLRRRNEEQGKVISQLVQEMEELRLKVEGYERRQEALLTAAADTVITQRFGANIAQAVNEQVARQLRAQEGLDRIIQDRVVAEITAAEARREAERLAAEQARTEEREERRRTFMDQRWTRLAEDLGLNESQTAGLRAASDAMREEMRVAMDALREMGGAGPEEFRQQAETLRSKYEAQLGQVLTPEQLDAYRNRPDSILRMMGFAAGREARRMGRGGEE